MPTIARLLPPWHGNRTVRFSIMSDLHLEVGQQYRRFHITPYAPRLILAGDIGRLVDYDPFRDFLQSVCEQFIQVFLVLGNHEFFGVSRQQGLALAKKMQQEPVLKDKLILMNRTRVDLDAPEPITVLGCTLHSNVPPESQDVVHQKISDFRHIGGWTVADHVAEHLKDVEWLEREIQAIRNQDSGSRRKVVVITHHAPSIYGTSEPAHAANPWSSAFATDLLGKGTGSCLDDVQCWIFGHTHYSTKFLRGTVKVVSNQRGYVFPNQNLEEYPARWPQLLPKRLRRGNQTNRFNAGKVIEV